jgi:hypothetical protein
MNYETIIDAFLTHRLRQKNYPSEMPIWKTGDTVVSGVAFYGNFSTLMLSRCANRLLDHDPALRDSALAAIKEQGVSLKVTHYEEVPKQCFRGMRFDVSNPYSLSKTEAEAFGALKLSIIQEACNYMHQLRSEITEIRSGGIDSLEYDDAQMEAKAQNIADVFDAKRTNS